MSSPLQEFLTHSRPPSSRLYFEEQLSPEWENEINDSFAQKTLLKMASVEISLQLDSIALWKFNYLQKQQGVIHNPPAFDFLGLPILCQRKILAEVDQKDFLSCQLVSQEMQSICQSVAKQRIFNVAEVQIIQMPDTYLLVSNRSSISIPFPPGLRINAKSFFIDTEFFKKTTVSIPPSIITNLSKVKCETLWINNFLSIVTEEGRVHFLQKLIDSLRPKYILGGRIGNLLSSKTEFEGLTAILTSDEEMIAVRARRLKVYQAQFSFSAVNVILKEWQAGTREIVKMEISWVGGRGDGENELLRHLGAEIIDNETWIKKQNGQPARIRIGPTTFTMKQMEMSRK